MSGIRSLLLLDKCKNMRQLKQIHAQISIGGLGDDSFLLSRILAFCSDPNKGSLNYACLLFERIANRTICIRNTMIKAYLQQGEFIRPMEIYCQLLRDGLCPDDYTLPYVLKACANLQDPQIGEQLHTHVLKLGFGSSIFVGSTLILMYSVCGDMNSAREVFDGIPQRTEVAWTIMINGYSMQGEVEEAYVLFGKSPNKDRGIWGSMISGYVRNNCFKEALMMFRLMQLAGVEPDEAVLVSVLSACGQVGAKDIGTWIHHHFNRTGSPLGIRLGTALMDMYAKCGELHLARKIFDGMIHRDTVCWNVMILGLAMHGDGLGALQLISRMFTEGFKPDDVTFIAILTACRHSGMVEAGLQMFNSMTVVHGIEPKSEHYGCMVDVLSRAGLFEEAKEILHMMPNSSSSMEQGIAWRAILSACANNVETELAEIAADELLKLKDQHSGVYVLLSNIYLSAGKHDDAAKMRRTMTDRRVPKIPGCSSIEIGGSVHEFVAGEEMHPLMDEIYVLLETMNGLLASSGNKSDCL